VRGCPSVHISARWSLESARWPFPWTVWVILAHVGSVFSTHRTSVGVCQHTQDVHGSPWRSVRTHRTSVAVYVCPCVSVCVRQHKQDVRGLHISARCSLDSARWPFPWNVWVILAHVDCLFSTHRTFVGVRQHTQDVCGCQWLSVSTHMTFVAVRVCLCVSLCVSQHTQDVRGCPSVHISARWTSVGVRQHTHGVRVCPSAHTGRP
ncbi:unnamed protein product, partial [Brassica rapa]